MKNLTVQQNITNLKQLIGVLEVLERVKPLTQEDKKREDYVLATINHINRMMKLCAESMGYDDIEDKGKNELLSLLIGLASITICLHSKTLGASMAIDDPSMPDSGPYTYATTAIDYINKKLLTKGENVGMADVMELISLYQSKPEALFMSAKTANAYLQAMLAIDGQTDLLLSMRQVPESFQTRKDLN